MGVEPTITMTTTDAAGQQQRQQVGLREYLNSRVMPYLRKALSESLDAA